MSEQGWPASVVHYRSKQQACTVTLLEASDAPGGRVRTDVVEGFRLDRGFQVMLTAYPEAKRLLDYDALAIEKIRTRRVGLARWQISSFRRSFPQPRSGAARFLFDPIVPVSDKLRVAKLRARVQRGTFEEIFARPEKTTRDYLQAVPFSARDHRAVLRAVLRAAFFWSANW